MGSNTFIAAAALYLAGCGPAPNAVTCPAFPGPSYGGHSSDETCRAVLGAEASAVTTGAQVPRFTSPAAGQTFARDATEITLRWTTPLDLDGDTASRRVTHPALAQWVSALNPISSAWAHGEVHTGAIHVVRLTGVGGSKDPILFNTSLLSWRFDPQTLAKVLATRGEMTIEVFSAYLTSDRIVDPASDGPFKSAPPTKLSIQ